MDKVKNTLPAGKPCPQINIHSFVHSKNIFEFLHYARPYANNQRTQTGIRLGLYLQVRRRQFRGGNKETKREDKFSS